MAASNSNKNPPVFKDHDDYEVWKRDISLWCEFTDIAKPKQAIAIHLSLTGRARQATSELKVEELKSDNGVKNIFTKLDRIFQQDENWRCFNAYLSFETFRKTEKQSMDEFLSEFDMRHFKLKECGVKLPDAIVACRLIKSCNLGEMQFQLALSTVPNMTFEDMRMTLKKLFSDIGEVGAVSNNIENKLAEVKVEHGGEESTLMAASFRGNRFKYRGRARGIRTRYRNSNDFRFDRRSNPIGPDGKISQCAICGSQMHWARSCPHSYENRNDYEEKVEEVKITLMAEHNSSGIELDGLLEESIGCGILDSGCSKTVCGEVWLSCYLDILDDSDKQNIRYENSSSVFKFGDGVLFKALKSVIFPCIIANKKVNIRADIISCNIPLLLSKSSMKRAGMVLDMSNDTVRVFDKVIKLKSTSIGHYVLPIYKILNSDDVNDILWTYNYDFHKGNVEKVVRKLHRQFAHPSALKLKELLRNARKLNIQYSRAVDKISSECDTCIRFKKPLPKPVVSLPLATRFNETVAMDLKMWHGLYFLVIVDVATRFCAGAVMKSKSADNVVTLFFKHWVSLFGTPQKLLSDNGREFNNEKVRNMADLFGIKILCTAAESPWSNGVCERLNYILGISVKKIMDDTKCNIDVALAWAVAARNALHNFGGFSPNQLVFGYNPIIPNICDSQPPMLSSRTNSQIVADNLNAMHSARQKFVENESSEKIKRALSHQVRSGYENIDNLKNGDFVYYKRNNNDEWHGPGTVIGMDGKQILVRHGGEYVRVHICRLQVKNDRLEQPLENPEPLDSSPNVDRAAISKNMGLNIPQIDELSLHEHNVNNSNDTELAENYTNRGDTEFADTHGEDFIYPSKNMKNPKIGSRIEYFEGENQSVARVLSRAGKAGGIYGHCFNIEKEPDNEVTWIDLFRCVEKWREVPDEEVNLLDNNKTDVLRAKHAEIEQWKRNDVFEEVEDEGQNTISVRWIVTEKVKNDSTYVKARLVARGFEEDWKDDPKDSPTCNKDSLRLALMVMSSFRWKCNSLDVKAAFLQGERIKRDVWLKPPREFYNGKIWKLKKTVYGLNDAARAWYFSVKNILLKLNMSICRYDPALFYWHNDDVLSGIICVHVDDFLWGGDSEFYDRIMLPLMKILEIGSTAEGVFKYLGLRIVQGKSNIQIDQGNYIKNIDEIELKEERRKLRSEPVNNDEAHLLRVLIGQLNWVVRQTRADVAFDCCELSTILHNAKVEDIIAANKVVQRLKKKDVTVVIPALDDVNSLSIECYSDASFGNLPGGGSQGGYIIFISDDSGHRCPVTWQSRKVRRVVKSTLAAETLALLDAAETGVYLATLMKQLLNLSVGPIVKCFVDNRSLVDALNSTTGVEDKLLRINMAVLKDMLYRRDLHSVSWVQTAHQLANALTKKGACPLKLIESIDTRYA